MGHIASADGNGRSAQIVVRVLRIEKGQSATLRMLSPLGLVVNGIPRIAGCMTFFKKHTHYFDRQNPPGGIKTTDLVWKGYLAAELYDQPTNRWYPTVFEVTEHCELDLRYRYDRGQVWKVRKELPTQKKKNPTVRAELLEERDPDTFPPPFDFSGVLWHVFHYPNVVLDVPNPLPGRTMIEASSGDPPPGVQAPVKPFMPPTAEQLSALHARMRGKTPPGENPSDNQ